MSREAPGKNGEIEPSGVASDYYPELSRFHQVLINQGQFVHKLLRWHRLTCA